MLLFKYVSNLDYILKDGYIRATQLSTLNDPFEANYDQNGLKQLVREVDNFYDFDVVDYIEKEKHKIGVISFSESKDNLLMWSHYANEHKGGLIAFYFNEVSIISDLVLINNFFNRTPFNGKCIPVKYRKQPIYKIDKFDRDYSHISAEGEDRLLHEIFQQKSDEWIYEKEHRIILKLEQADRIVIDKEDIKKYEYKKEILFKKLIENNIPIENDFIEFTKDKLYIYLDRIEDKSYRSIFASFFASLAKGNPNIVFLFKISTSRIFSIAYGHRNENIKEYKIEDKYMYFEMLKTNIDKFNYTLGFEKIKDVRK